MVALRNWFAGLAVAASLTPMAAQAQVGYVLEAEHPLYTAQPGELVHVNIYLREVTAGGDSSLLIAEDGLSQAEVALDRLPGPAEPAAIITVAPSSAFGDLLFDGSLLPGFVDLTQAVPLGLTRGPDGQGNGGRVQLLALDLQAGTVVGESTWFTIYDNPGFEETCTFANTALDGLITPGQFEVSVAPEPSTLAVMALTFASLCFRKSPKSRSV